MFATAEECALRCTLTRGGWVRVGGLIDEFLETQGDGALFQYLIEAGPTELVLATEFGW